MAVLGSFMGDYHVFQQLLSNELTHQVRVVGVASDDPTQAFTHPAVGMHRITWPQMGSFIRREVGTMLNAVHPMLTSTPLALQEEVVPYHTGSHRQWAKRLAA